MGTRELFFRLLCDLPNLKVEKKEVTEEHAVSAFPSRSSSWVLLPSAAMNHR